MSENKQQNPYPFVFMDTVANNATSLSVPIVVQKPPKKNAPKPKKKIAKVTFDSVILHEDKKEQIQETISQLDHADLIFEKWGFGEVFEKGTAVSLLFYGVPGTGKTLMAQAIAEHTGSDVKVISTADIETSEPGGAERTIRKIFAEVMKLFQEKKPTILLFDECDSLLYSREKAGTIRAAQVNELLVQIEKFTGVIIFTTNRLGQLDAALDRRISAKIEFEFPDHATRIKIWERMIPKDAPIHKDVDFAKLAEYEIAGGNIKNAVLNAARKAAYRKSKTIRMSHFNEAAKKEIESLQKYFEARARSPKPGGYDSLEVDEETGLIKKQDRIIKRRQVRSLESKLW